MTAWRLCVQRAVCECSSALRHVCPTPDACTAALPLDPAAGDQTAHLIWRLENGEMPQKNKPKVVVLLIGTNDLGAARGEVDERGAEDHVMQAVPGVTLRWGRGL